MISKQESCHLVLGTPMVSCSHMFIKINLRNTKVRRADLAPVYNADEISESNKTPEERLREGEMETNNNPSPCVLPFHLILKVNCFEEFWFKSLIYNS